MRKGLALPDIVKRICKSVIRGVERAQGAAKGATGEDLTAVSGCPEEDWIWGG